jgi:integrase/recombinase XerD
MHLNHVKTYENYLATEKGRQASTITAYSRDVKRFETWICENVVNPVDWGMVTTQHIRAYMAYNPEIGPRRFHRVVSSLRSWFEYLHRIAQVIVNNPAATVGKPKLPKRLPKYLRADDMQKLLQSCAKNSRTNEQFRDVNLTAFLYGTGLRINEALGLKLEDIRYKTEADGFQTPISVRVIGKGDKERMVPLSDTAQRALFQWLRRRKLEGGSTPFVWVQLTGTGRGKVLTDRGVRRMVNARSIDAGLGPLSPHKLRSSYASALIEAGVGIDKVASILGHESINTTRLYVQQTEGQLESAVKSLPDVLDVMPLGGT